MSTMKTATVTPTDGYTRTGGLGRRNDINHLAMFRSPLFAEYNDVAVMNAGTAALIAEADRPTKFVCNVQ